jgi:hypothetical protein
VPLFTQLPLRSVLGNPYSAGLHKHLLGRLIRLQ